MSAPVYHRPRGIKWLLIGAVLTVVGAGATWYGAHYLADSNVEVSRAVELLMALPALMTAGGLVGIYHGAALLLFGEVVGKIDWQRITLAGLLYALGFAATLALAMYLAFGVFGVLF